MMSQEEKEARKAAMLKSDYVAPWIGVDLDSCLAIYDGWKGEEHIGEPIPLMVDRVKQWLAEGKIVKIFTARASEPNPEKRVRVLAAIARWSLEVFGTALPVTCIKDYGCKEIYDDRAVGIEPNTGQLMTDVAYNDGYNDGYMGVEPRLGGE